MELHGYQEVQYNVGQTICYTLMSMHFINIGYIRELTLTQCCNFLMKSIIKILTIFFVEKALNIRNRKMMFVTS